MWSQRQTPRSSIAASETFGYQPGPAYGNRFRQDCLPPQSAGPAHAVHGLNAVRRAQDGQGEGGVGRLQPTTPTPSWWAARSPSASSCCGSRRAAPAGFARCPQRPASPAPRGPARRRRPSARSRTARTCFCHHWGGPSTRPQIWSGFWTQFWGPPVCAKSQNRSAGQLQLNSKQKLFGPTRSTKLGRSTNLRFVFGAKNCLCRDARCRRPCFPAFRRAFPSVSRPLKALFSRFRGLPRPLQGLGFCANHTVAQHI